jgi:hypothetical protein
MDDIAALVAALRQPSEAASAAKARLRELAGAPDGAAVREQLDTLRKGELLEVQWEIEDVLEATTPKKAAPPPRPAEPPKKEAPPDPNKPLGPKDLTLVYDDPRGLALHRSKVGDRWFATQVDPRTGQPQTFELYPQEIGQLKQQLAGSPYWVLGGGGPDGPKAPAPKPPGR